MTWIVLYTDVRIVGENYRYDETLVVPIVENTPEECDLKVGLVNRSLCYLSVNLKKQMFSK